MSLTYSEVFAAIGANDFPATVQFYKTLFGREPDEQVRDIYVEFRLDGLRLGIFDPRESNRQHFANPAEHNGGLSLVLRVYDLDQSRAMFEGLGSARSPGPVEMTSHGREYFAYDPDGNRLIIVEHNVEP